MKFEVLRRFARDRRGNVAMIFALTLPVVIFAVGASIDYGIFATQKSRLAVIADEAALSAVSNTEMSQTVAQAQQLAQNVFIGQASQLSQIVLGSGQPSVTITTNATTQARTATVAYSVTYNTIFWGVLGVQTISATGQSVAQSAPRTGPNTNFYILADNQGSMALPATQAGVTQMEALTPQQNPGGCAYACHEVAPNEVPPTGWVVDTAGNPYGQDIYTGASCKKGGKTCDQIDNYQLAKNNGITLRFDEVTTAVSQLISYASTTQANLTPPPTYQFAIYSVDSQYTQGLYSVMPLTANYTSQWATDSGNLKIYTVWSDGGACAPATVNGTLNQCGTYADSEPQSTYLNVGYFSSPMGTEMQTLASTIPAAGSGTGTAPPKEVLLVVTDGMEETVVGGNLSITTWDSTALGACTTMKNNGVQIAILYTTYYPTPGFHLYDDYVATFISNIGPTLQSCASPGLFMTAQLGDDLTQDFQNLFNLANQGSALTK